LETPLINDLNICVATENGSGSASSNNILFKAIFKMGIPCSSKNMFPSNIQGLPTWYQIRANADGYLSRKDVIDVMVMFNDTTAAKDIYRVRDGGVLLYDDSTPLSPTLKRDGIQYIGFPANKLVQTGPRFAAARKQRKMFVGALLICLARYVGHQSGSRGHFGKNRRSSNPTWFVSTPVINIAKSKVTSRISPDWNRFPAATKARS
jgi:Pyruvate/2-oxoacid:ferredoxin oxidoreductase gamma subunit